MGYQNVRALTPIRHSGVLRIPGQTSGDNAQDFVAEDTQANRLVALGYATSLGIAAAPVVPGQSNVAGGGRDLVIRELPATTSTADAATRTKTVYEYLVNIGNAYDLFNTDTEGLTGTPGVVDFIQLISGTTYNEFAQLRVTVDGVVVMQATPVSVIFGNWWGAIGNLPYWTSHLYQAGMHQIFKYPIPWRTSCRIEYVVPTPQAGDYTGMANPQNLFVQLQYRVGQRSAWAFGAKGVPILAIDGSSPVGVDVAGVNNFGLDMPAATQNSFKVLATFPAGVPVILAGYSQVNTRFSVGGNLSWMETCHATWDSTVTPSLVAPTMWKTSGIEDFFGGSYYSDLVNRALVTVQTKATDGVTVNGTANIDAVARRFGNDAYQSGGMDRGASFVVDLLGKYNGGVLLPNGGSFGSVGKGAGKAASNVGMRWAYVLFYYTYIGP